MNNLLIKNGDVVISVGNPSYVSGNAMLVQYMYQYLQDYLGLDGSVIGIANSNDFGVGLVNSVVFIKLNSILNYLKDYLNNSGGINRLPQEKISDIDLILVVADRIDPTVLRWYVSVMDGTYASVSLTGAI
jgi:hypothetical protein